MCGGWKFEEGAASRIDDVVSMLLRSWRGGGIVSRMLFLQRAWRLTQHFLCLSGLRVLPLYLAQILCI